MQQTWESLNIRLRSDFDPDKPAHMVCPHDCPDTCSLRVQKNTTGQLKVTGDPDHPVTRGWLCSKVRDYPQQMLNSERLHQPLRRYGDKGCDRWLPITWEDAIEEICSRWQQLIARHGAHCILPYSFSGTLGLVQMQVCNARLWHRMGARALNRSICGAAAETAVKATLGSRLGVPYEQALDSRLILIWGSNPHASAPHFMPFLRQARRNGTRIIVIDPIPSQTALGADQHIQPRPGSDLALALAMAHWIVAKQWHDPDWLQAHCHGTREYLEHLQHYTPAWAAEKTGLTATAIEQLASDYATTRPALIRISDGLSRHTRSGQAVRAICTLPALTAQYGKPGGGLMYSTSDGCTLNRSLLDPFGPVHRDHAVNMGELGRALTGQLPGPAIHALYVYGANPVVSSPNTSLILQGLGRDDLFTVVHELFMTDTARQADMVLPATSQFEHSDLHKAYGQYGISLNQPVCEPLGESRSNWDVMRLLAKGLGYHDAPLQQTAEQIIDELLADCAQRNHFSAQEVREQGYAFPPHATRPPFADDSFATAEGKLALFSSKLQARQLPPLPTWVATEEEMSAEENAVKSTSTPLQLLSVAALHFISSSFANVPRLKQLERGPCLYMNTKDARERGIEDGETVRVVNRNGQFMLPVRLRENVLRGSAYTHKGFWRHPQKGSCNEVTTDIPGDFSGQSAFQSTWVEIESIAG